MTIFFEWITSAIRTHNFRHSNRWPQPFEWLEIFLNRWSNAFEQHSIDHKRMANGKRTVLRRPERIAVVYVFAGEVKCYVSSQGTWKFPCTCHMFHRKEHGNFHVPCHMFHLKVHGKCHVPCQGICFVARYMEISMFPAGFAFHMRYLWKKSCSLR